MSVFGPKRLTINHLASTLQTRPALRICTDQPPLGSSVFASSRPVDLRDWWESKPSLMDRRPSTSSRCGTECPAAIFELGTCILMPVRAPILPLRPIPDFDRMMFDNKSRMYATGRPVSAGRIDS